MSTVTDLISSTATNAGISPALALSVAQTESNFNQAAVSKAGAIGVMQLMPGTAAGLGVNPYDTAQNIQGGVAYLSQQLAAYGGDQAKALAAYNAGPGRVNQAIASAAAAGDPSNWLAYMPAETQAYVPAILGPDYSAPAPSSSVAVAPAIATPSDTAAAYSDASLLDLPAGEVDIQPAGISGTALAVIGGAVAVLLLIRG